MIDGKICIKRLHQMKSCPPGGPSDTPQMGRQMSCPTWHLQVLVGLSLSRLLLTNYCRLKQPATNSEARLTFQWPAIRAFNRT